MSGISDFGGSSSNQLYMGPRKALAYPSPFFDISQRYVPRNIKEIFKWTQYHYTTNSIIYPIVNKLAEYPITGFIYNDVAEDAQKTWEKVVEQTLDMRSTLISIIEDMLVYGNSFCMVHYPFIRYLIAPDGTKWRSTQVSYEIKFREKKWTIWGKHPKTGSEVEFKVKDVHVANKSMLKLVRINPNHINIEHNSFTGTSYYYYNIPNEDRKRIKTNSKVYLDNTPAIIFDAIAQGKNIQLDENHFYHFKRPAIAGLWPGWGTPALTPVLRDVHYLAVLRKANEAIALQRIVPLMVLFPAANADITPFRSVDLSSWKNKVESELARWRKDPNHIPIMPIPIGQTLLGGDAKALMVTQEMEFVARGIAAALGVPIEFIQGGLNWSGSSISLRILENSFIKMREEMTEFLNNFLIPRISKYFKLPKVTINLKSFKMADDVQFQQIMVNLMQNGFVSRKRVLDQWDISSEEEYRQLKIEHAQLAAIQRDDMVSQAEVQALSQQIQMRSQVIAQAEATKLQQELQNDVNDVGDGLVDTPIAAQDLGQKYAAQIMVMPPESAMSILKKMKNEMPALFELVMQSMQKMQANAAETQQQQQAPQPGPQSNLGGQTGPIGGNLSGKQDNKPTEGVDMRPLPEQRAPNRKNNSV